MWLVVAVGLGLGGSPEIMKAHECTEMIEFAMQATDDWHAALGD